MLIINKTKPFYIDKTNKVIRMGNFTDTGKEIYYDDESLLSIFKNLSEPISRNELIKIVKNDTNVDNIEIENAIDYLISESFIINNDDYIKILKNEDYNRQNLFFICLQILL